MAKETKAQREERNRDELYFQKAAAQVVYPVDIYNRTIDVPDNEVDQALSDPMIQHLLSERCKFQIQRCIPERVIKKEIYSPELKTRIMPVAETTAAYVKIGDCFQIQSGVILDVTRVNGDMVYTKARGQMTGETPVGINTLKEMIKRKAWCKL